MSSELGPEIGIEEIHQVQLELMKQIDRICAEQQLTYFLYWGTLIGAVRHNGFIPWDDDADIVMLRPDYEKLIAYLAAHETELYPLRLMHYSTNEKYLYPIARISDDRYKVVFEHEPVDYGLGVFVDLYPFDGWSNRKEETPAYFRARKYMLKNFFLSVYDHFPAGNGAKWKLPLKWILYRRARRIGTHGFIIRMDEAAKKYSIEDYAYVGNLNWAQDDREGTEKANLIPIRHPFEDTELSIPQGYDRILRDYYGNYMQYPPEEERCGHHSYKAYRKLL